MIRLLFLSLFLPSCLFAQESKDYLALIREDAAVHPAVDSARDMRLATLRLFKRHSLYSEVKAVRIRNGKLEFVRNEMLRLTLGGTYSAGYTFKRAGALPTLQQDYAQGRGGPGGLTWRGAETGEMFSYGPALSSLEYDGSVYPYDADGRLVPSGSGNGRPAKAYGNNLLRNGSLFNQSFSLSGDLNSVTGNILTFNVRLGHSNEQLILPENRNTSRQLDVKLNAHIRRLELRTAYLLHEDNFTNSSRNGFLQRVYRNALLTPASFDNNYGSMAPAYGGNADNPRFLLENNGHYFRRQQQGTLGLLLRTGSFNLKAVQSYEDVNEKANESYMPGTAGFPAGAITLRDKHDRAYFLQTEARYYLPRNNSDFNMEASATYVFTDNHSTTGYRLAAMEYDYRRSAGNLTLQYDIKYNDGNKIRAGLELGAFSYFSNTTKDNNLFTPMLNGYFIFNDYNESRLELKANLSYRQTATELPVNNSLAYANLLRYPVEQVNRYLPNTEVDGFDGLNLTKIRSWSAGASVMYKNYVRFTADIFRQQTLHDVFPLAVGDRLELRNAGSHLRKGIELELEKMSSYRNNAFNTSFSASFTTWKHTVTAVENGYDYTPLAGFSDVYKVMAKDQPFGAIMGSAWLRDGSGRVVIDTDGFPTVAPGPKIIGNPIPDFIVKLEDHFSYKKISLRSTFEWRKGGDVWNGTAAVLDYYGRSAQTGEQRNTSGYIFPGVTADGHPNTIPVEFYNPLRPLDQNRWVRYGFGGVAEDYIEKGDCIRLRTAELSYYWNLKKIIRKITLSASVGNIILWKTYSGSDPDLLLFDQPNTAGLDFFQLPSLQTYGMHLSLQF
ncbi:hypothetical protein [Chitinophaga barathri]|uniref:TonB-dependent receptor n=1 Tax=Chitinophaga barathri TaxID=1647451 RepID=A0A3N4MI79_9BACT|nr:hypothetical protein [Chitinophaga barathri]RPD39770.1 hypothetical protein EG028_19230 [Chitinophaga barathri]